MTEQLQAAIKPTIAGCLCCGTLAAKLSMRSRIGVGFGSAYVMCGDKVVWQEKAGDEWSDLWTVQKAENAARKSPDSNWRIVLRGPLRGRTYQRHGRNLWCLIEENEGFA